MIFDGQPQLLRDEGRCSVDTLQDLPRDKQKALQRDQQKAEELLQQVRDLAGSTVPGGFLAGSRGPLQIPGRFQGSPEDSWQVPRSPEDSCQVPGILGGFLAGSIDSSVSVGAQVIDSKIPGRFQEPRKIPRRFPGVPGGCLAGSRVPGGFLAGSTGPRKIPGRFQGSPEDSWQVPGSPEESWQVPGVLEGFLAGSIDSSVSLGTKVIDSRVSFGDKRMNHSWTCSGHVGSSSSSPLESSS